MSRKRIIDTELYFDTELFDLLGCEGLHLYIRLWGVADDSGIYEPRYPDIALKMGALKFTPEKVKKYVSILIKAEKVIVYSVNAKEYHWLKNFLKYQQLSSASLPRYPLPDWIEYEERQYPSGKKFATYRIVPEKLAEITSRLPVGYREATSNGETIETKRNQSKLLRESFNLFFKEYPLKVKEDVAFRAWSKIRPDNGLVEQIMATLEKYKQSEQWKEKQR